MHPYPKSRLFLTTSLGALLIMGPIAAGAQTAPTSLTDATMTPNGIQDAKQATKPVSSSLRADAAAGLALGLPAGQTPSDGSLQTDLPSSSPAKTNLEPSSSAQTAAAAAPQPPDGTQSSGGQIQSADGPIQTAQPSPAEKTQYQKAQEEVQEQEKQRVAGIVPNFNVTYHQDAVPLSPGQKMSLALHSSLDPFSFASAFLEAGYHEVDNDLVGFPWGAKGYFERSGVAYLDTVDGTILSNGLVPILFHQDPRYFRLGYGPTGPRVWRAISSSFIAKSDRSGRWQPNYGNLLGNLAAGGISNLYYPPGNTGISLTMTTFAIQIAEGIGGSLFEEFWPDISRKLLHRDPTHGLDAQAKADYQAKQALKQQPEQKQIP
ncbi:MAG: hypothetical protein ACP5E5_07100 [Acidobacteriaceae bacterium]